MTVECEHQWLPDRELTSHQVDQVAVAHERPMALLPRVARQILDGSGEPNHDASGEVIPDHGGLAHPGGPQIT